ncbi:Abi family protein [Rhodococcus sp. ABRD24]|uniref:Abi family protein n=1 Tax=Rhodococcus sp. ABRD24 TaxID=2507582 RepID=UPI0013F16273|nr:Abi family protein [Rhodococcus sp. ABRD24]
MTSTYDKPFLDVDGQLDRLRDRGLVFEDREFAYRELQAIGYYRLSGYWYPFRQRPKAPGEQRPSEFVEGATLKEVLEIYRFDERLRIEILHALSHIEVAMRFRIGHLLGRRGPFAHNEAAELDSGWTTSEERKGNGPNCSADCTWSASGHEEWMRKQERNEEVSNEAFIAHFDSNYGKPLPVWTATEVMSFGDLNRLFSGMTQRDRQQIAVDFDLCQEDGNGDAGALSNWLEHLRQTRNFCAHHGRLWNRNHTAPLSMPFTVKEMAHMRGDGASGALPVSRPASRIYGSLVLITYLLARINHSNETRDRIRALIEAFAAERTTRLSDMGFPDGWESEEIWQVDYARDEELAARAYLLRGVELLYASDAAARLWHKEGHKERSSRLGYYRKNGAVLSVPGVEAHRYPAFQFDAETGDLFPLAVIANRRLLQGRAGSEKERWAALKWWDAPCNLMPENLSPRQGLESGALKQEVLDALLARRDDE